MIDFDIESAINPTTVEVTFNQEVEAVDEVVVTNKDGVKVYVKSTELAEDKKSATVTLYDALKSGEEYKVAVTVGETVVESTFEFVVGAPATVELASQEVDASNGTVAYKILDENGVDVTKALPTGYTVSIATDNSTALTYSNGEIKSTLAAGKSAFLTVIVKDKEGKEVAKSERVTITAKATPKLTEFGADWTLGTANFTSDDYKQVTSVGLKGTATLAFNYVDQYGEPIGIDGGSVEFTSLSTDVAIVDKATGKVTPVKTGKAAIRATLLGADGKKLDTRTIEITVTEETKLQTLIADKEEVSVTVGGTDSVVTFKGEDQFGNAIATGALTAKSADEKVAKAVVNGSKVEISAVAKGSTTVTVSVGNVTKTIAVTVAEFDKVADYSLEGGAAELKTKDVSTTADVNETEITYEVFAKDANGTLNVEPSTATFVVTDKDGKEIETAEEVANLTVAYASGNYEIGETYTVTATVGTLEVGTSTFTVVDNGVAPKLTFDELTFTAEGHDFDLENTTVLDIVKDLVTPKVATTATAEITDIKFTTGNSAVIPTSTKEAKIIADGTAVLYATTITVEVSDKGDGLTKAEELGTFEISVTGKDITVVSTVVADKAAKELADKVGEQETALDGKTAADYKLDNVEYTNDADGKAAIKAALEGKLAALGTEDDDYVVAVTSVTPAVDGVDGDEAGTPGKFTFTITLADGTTVKTFTDVEITPVAFE